MLANAADATSEVMVRPLFARILSELTPEEVRVLDWVYENGKPAKPPSVPQPPESTRSVWSFLYQSTVSDTAAALGYRPTELVVMLSNFYRQGICEPPGNTGYVYHAADGTQVGGQAHTTFFLTPLGVAFVKACRYP